MIYIKQQDKGKTMITQEALVKEYFEKHPNEDIETSKAVDWLVPEYQSRTGKLFRDPPVCIRNLCSKGFLQKIRKKIYRYSPDYVQDIKSDIFSEKQRKEILKRDEYKCVVCGKGKREGANLEVDHIKAQAHGGRAEILNGQTLCSVCHRRKDNYEQTEFAKKMFIRLYNSSKSKNDMKFLKFCTEILQVYENNCIDEHIKWDK